MKTLLLTTCALIIAISCYSQEWVEFTPATATEPDFTVVSSSDTVVEFNVIIPGMYVTQIDSFQRLSIARHYKTDSVGFPEVPVISCLVAIPQCDSVSLHISFDDSLAIEDMYIYPVPILVEDTTEEGYEFLREQFEYNDSAYSGNFNYPGFVAQLKDKGAVRAQNCIRVVLFPVQYKPASKTAIIYSKMNVILTFFNPVDSVNKNVGIFNEMLGNTLINYESNGLNATVSCGGGIEDPGSWKWVTSFPNQYIEEECDYLIITNEEFHRDSIAKNAIEQLAEHRANFNGFDVIIVKTEDIYYYITGIDQSYKIRNLIANTYDKGNANHTWDGKLGFVLLFGDAFMSEGTIDCVPTYPYYTYVLGGNDVFYTKLTGLPNPDLYPDIMIGRLSVDERSEIQNVITKLLNYTPGNLAWKDKMTVVLDNAPESYQHFGYLLHAMCTIIGGQYEVNLFKPHDYNGYVPEWNLLQYNKSTFLTDYSNGKMFLNYMGHGGTWGLGGFGGYGFTYSDLSGSQYVNKLPFIIACACKTGLFQDRGIMFQPCVAEDFLCNDSDKGAIGYIGASWFSTSVDFDVLPDFYESFIHDYSLIPGETVMEVKIKNANNVHLCNLYNLFCDPALNLKYENITSYVPDLFVYQC